MNSVNTGSCSISTDTAELVIFGHTPDEALNDAKVLCRWLARKLKGAIWPPKPQGFDKKERRYAVKVDISLLDGDREKLRDSVEGLLRLDTLPSQGLSADPR